MGIYSKDTDGAFVEKRVPEKVEKEHTVRIGSGILTGVVDEEGKRLAVKTGGCSGSSTVRIQ